MKRIVLPAVCAVLLLASRTAGAGGLPGNADLHFYAGVGVGWNKLADYCGNPLPNALGAPDSENCEDSETSIKAFGGIEFYRYFGLELGYVDLGKDIRHTGKYNQGSDAVAGAFEFSQRLEFDPSLSAAVVGRLPWEDFAFSAKLGLHKWEMEVTGFCRGAEDVCGPIEMNAAAGIGTAELDGTDIFYGLGTQYNFSNGLALRTEWERYILNEGALDDHIDLFSVSALYRF